MADIRTGARKVLLMRPGLGPRIKYDQENMWTPQGSHAQLPIILKNKRVENKIIRTYILFENFSPKDNDECFFQFVNSTARVPLVHDEKNHVEKVASQEARASLASRRF